MRSQDLSKKEFDSDFLADFSFIFGDMNYRLDTRFDKFIHEVHTAADRLDELDQLTKQMKQRSEHLPPYPDYEEAPIRFLPTYKRAEHNDV